MMNHKKSIFVIIVLILSVGCQKEYEYNVAYVNDDAKYIHWGRGFYKLKVSYEFKYYDSIYKKYDNPTKGLYNYNYKNKKYYKGDSILIQYPKGKPSKSEVVRLIYKKE
jgi:ribosomal protein S17